MSGQNKFHFNVGQRTMDGGVVIESRATASTAEAQTTGADSKVKLIIAGAGNWGKVLSLAAYKLRALVAITDDVPKAMQDVHAILGSPAHVKLHTTLQDALRAHPTAAVVVATPPATHYEVAAAALDAGRDVWVEKPMCLRPDQATELVARSKKLGRILFVDHLLRYNRVHEKVLQLVKQGWVGLVTRVKTLRQNFGTVRTKENVLWSFGPHDVSLVLSLCEDKQPVAVYASGQAVVSNGIEDYMDLLLEFEDGVRAHINTSWLHYEKERRLIVYGTEGCIIVNETDRYERPTIEGYKWSADREENGSAVNIQIDQQDIDQVSNGLPVNDAMIHFLECCRTRRAPLTDGEEGLRVLNVLAAADQSLARKCRVLLRNSDDNNPDNSIVIAPPENEIMSIQEVKPVIAAQLAQNNSVVMTVQVPQPSLQQSQPKVEDEAMLTTLPRHNHSSAKIEAMQTDFASPAAHSAGPLATSTLKPADIEAPAPDYYVHPTAVVDDRADVGKDTKIWHFSHVMGGARIGADCSFGQNCYVGGAAVIGSGVKVQNGVSIYDGVEIKDNAFLGPHCTFTNVKTPRAFINRRAEFAKTVVGRGATIGANATIVCGNSVGMYSLVGAGAVVTHNVPDYACVVGNPAKFQSWVSESGTRLQYHSEGDNSTTWWQCPETKDFYIMYESGPNAVVRKRS